MTDAARSAEPTSRRLLLELPDLDLGRAGLNVDVGAQYGYLFGWWRATTRQARAVVTLVDADLAYETVPILRSMTEHSVLVPLLVQRATFWRTLERARLRRIESLMTWFDEEGLPRWELLQEYADLLGRETSSDVVADDRLGVFRHQVELLPDQARQTAWIRFQFLTHHGHAGAETALSHYGPRGWVDPPIKGGAALALAAVLLFEVLEAVTPLVYDVEQWSADLERHRESYNQVRAALAGAPYFTGDTLRS